MAGDPQRKTETNQGAGFQALQSILSKHGSTAHPELLTGIFAHLNTQDRFQLFTILTLLYDATRTTDNFCVLAAGLALSYEKVFNKYDLAPPIDAMRAAFAANRLGEIEQLSKCFD